MQKLNIQIVEQLIKSEYISPDYKDAYLYCFDYFYENLKYDLILMGSSVILKKVLLTTIFLLFFNILRYFSGGYHASNAFICNLLSYSAYVILILGSYVLSCLDKTVFFGLFVTSSIIVATISPVDHPNKRYDFARCKRARKVVCIILIIESVLFGIFYKNDNIHLLYALT